MTNISRSKVMVKKEMVQELFNWFYNHRLVLLVTLGYAIAVSIFAAFHEVWRDEAVPMTLSAESHSLGELLSSSRSYGHPPLFQLLLYWGYKIFPHYIVLKIINIAICVAAVYIFLSKAPFSWMQKILFICGILPLYIYPVINRNYGISMLLIFIVSVLYKERFNKIIPFSIALVLLAYAHAHSFIIMMAVVFSMIVEMLFMRDNVAIQKPRPAKLVIGFMIIGVNIIYLLIWLIPDKTSSIFSVDSLSIPAIREAFVHAVFFPGITFSKIFGFDNSLFANIIIWALYAYLLSKINLLIIYSSAVVALTVFIILVYPSDLLRHLGSLYLLMVFIFWADTYPSKKIKIPLKIVEKLMHFISSHINAFFTFLLIIHVCMAYPVIRDDILRPYSSSKDLAAFIKKNPSLKEAIITAEPGSMLESLPYYLDNPIYLYRENRFGKVRKFSTDTKLASSMEYLLSSIEQLQKKYDREIIILLGKKIKPEGPYLVNLSYQRSFNYSKESLQAFFDATEKIAGFHNALSDENCDVYLLKSSRKNNK